MKGKTIRHQEYLKAFVYFDLALSVASTQWQGDEAFQMFKVY